MRGLKRSSSALVAAGLVLLAACAGSDDGATENTQPATTETTAAPTTTDTPATTINERERRRAMGDFLELAEINANCSTIDCLGSDATYNRYDELRSLAEAIPGDDVAPRVEAISTAFDEWTVCLGTATDGFDCATEEDAVAAAIAYLYDLLLYCRHAVSCA
jgi:hypothetical protein